MRMILPAKCGTCKWGGIVACHPPLGNRLLKSCLFARCSRWSSGEPALHILLGSNYIIHILFIPSKETSNYYYTICTLPPQKKYCFGKIINYNLEDCPPSKTSNVSHYRFCFVLFCLRKCGGKNKELLCRCLLLLFNVGFRSNDGENNQPSSLCFPVFTH